VNKSVHTETGQPGSVEYRIEKPSLEGCRHEAGLTASETGPQVIVVAGGSLGQWTLPCLKTDSFFIGADRGALFLIHNGLTPDAALGDFDSVTEAEKELIRASSKLFLDCDPVRKDLTDTEWALDWAFSLNPSSITLLGVTGTRFDHTLANVQLLVKASQHGIPCRIIDAHNEIRLLASGGCLTLDRGEYGQVSLLPLGDFVTGITLEGFLYPLHEASLELGQSLGISNVIVGEAGTVRIRQGLLLVIQSRD
jgi:thiamine pyrophosphokinase